MTENCGCGFDLIFPQGSNAGLVIQNGLYGVCSTNASTQEKKVDIEGFTSENLVEGTCIAVRFVDMQLYNGIPKLNVSGTGAKNIQSRAGTNAGKGEWYTGQIVEFVYYNNAWVIVDGFHATTNYYGKTKLTDDFSVVDMNSAATGQMVTALAGFVAKGWLWDGNEHESTVLVDTLTPDGGDWDPYTDQLDTATIHYTDFGSVVNYNPYYMRMLKVTFGDRVFFKGLDYIRPFEEISIYYDEDYTDARIRIGTSQTEFICHPPYADLTFKIELYSGYGDAGLVTYPMLKDYSGGGGSTLLVTITENGSQWVCDKTWKEMYDAAMAGSQVWVKRENQPWDNLRGLVTSFDVNQHGIYFRLQSTDYSMFAADENGYPDIWWD